MEKLQEWQRPKSPSTMGDPVESDPRADQIADVLNCHPEEVVETVEALDERVRELVKSRDDVRTRWIDYWWEAVVEESEDYHQGPLVVSLEEGSFDDVQQLAKSGSERDRVMVIVYSPEEEAFAVGVSDDLHDEFDASEIAQRIAEAGNGGAGGSKKLATGGGIESTELQGAIMAEKDRIDSNVG